MKTEHLSKKDFEEIYRLLDRVSPLETDCGALCGAACCTAGGGNDSDMGLFLLPGEEEMHRLPGGASDGVAGGTSDNTIGNAPGGTLGDASCGAPAGSLDESWLDWSELSADELDFPPSWRGRKVFFARCKTPPVCPREKRPIQCRTFPLAPHIDADGELSMVYNDLELPYECPLIYEEIPLEDDFVEATLAAWQRLIRDPLIHDLVRADSEAREASFSELAALLGEGV